MRAKGVGHWLLLIVMMSASMCRTCYADRQGRVIAIHDGDTVTVQESNNREVVIRLSEIDAPELDQPFGIEAKRMLSELSEQRLAVIHEKGSDRYGRLIARMHIDSVDVNAEMVKLGGAWAYRKYLTEASLLLIEDQARRAKLGLWQRLESNRLPPWAWRKSKHVVRTPGESEFPRRHEVGAPSAGMPQPAR